MTDNGSSGNWSSFKKIFETQGAFAAFKQLTSADERGPPDGAAQSGQIENPLTRLKEAAVQRWTSQVEAMQTDFSCGFFAPPDKRERKEEQAKRPCSELDLGALATRRSNRMLDDRNDETEISVEQVLMPSTECSIDQNVGKPRHLNSDVALAVPDFPEDRFTPPVDRDVPTTQTIQEVDSQKVAPYDRLDSASVASSETNILPEVDGVNQHCFGEHDHQTEIVGMEGPSAEEPPELSECPALVHRRRKPTAANDWSNSDAMRSYDPALRQLHEDLMPGIGTMQVVGCMDASEELPLDKPVWLVSADGEVSIVDAGSCEPWIWNFATEGLELAVQCRSGRGTACINQDNFSIAHAPGDRAIFTVCDGHGPYGCLVAFRIAQCLPKSILEGMVQRPQDSIEQIVATAFRSTNVSLHNFARKHGLDCSLSGATCAVAVRHGSNVHVAWLGDSRALVASVTEDGYSQVNLFSPAHDVTEEIEYARLLSKGSEPVMLNAEDGLRMAAPNQNGQPGLTVSRAFGDFAMTPHGVLSHPDLVKTSFSTIPGLVLLASSGACEFQDDGEVLLERVIGEGQLVERGVQHALSRVCEVAQNAWLTAHDSFCDDVTALLLYWRAPSQELSRTTSQNEEFAHPQGKQPPSDPSSFDRRVFEPNTPLANRDEQTAILASNFSAVQQPSATIAHMPTAANRIAPNQQCLATRAVQEVTPIPNSQGRIVSFDSSVTGLQQGTPQSFGTACVEGPMIVRRDHTSKYPNSGAGLNGKVQSNQAMPEGPVFTANARSYRN